MSAPDEEDPLLEAPPKKGFKPPILLIVTAVASLAVGALAASAVFLFGGKGGAEHEEADPHAKTMEAYEFGDRLDTPEANAAAAAAAARAAAEGEIREDGTVKPATTPAPAPAPAPAAH